jgi:hypothetical protein
MQLPTDDAQPSGTGASIEFPKSSSGEKLLPRTGKNGLGAFLRSQDYPISDRFIEVLCGSPNEGPEPAMRWGRSYLYAPSTVLSWAEARGKRLLEVSKARAERRRASRDAELERRAQRASA